MTNTTSEKHRVYISYFWPDWWENFLRHCNDIAESNNCSLTSVIKKELKPHGKYMHTSAKGAYIEWDHVKYYAAFLLRWA